MRSGFTSFRARLAASAAALVGLSFVGGCHDKRAAEPAPTKAPEVTIPEPVAAPVEPGDDLATTLAIGEEDGGSVIPADPGMATTLAIGEEDGGYVQPAPSEPTITTLAVGEEDGSGPIPVEPGGGIGDGAGPPPVDTATTLAIGEEDGGYEKIYIPDPDNAAPALSYGQATTLAIGEEG